MILGSIYRLVSGEPGREAKREQAAGSGPGTCWIGYLRFRASGGPAGPDGADAVMTLMPGLAAGIQNNGKPDEVSASLTRFILTGVPGR